MDLSSILPLLMSKGSDNNQMASILSAMTGDKTKGGMDPSMIMNMMNKNGSNNSSQTASQSGDAGNMSPIFDILKNRAGGGSNGNNAMDMVSLMSALNKNNRRPAQGLKPVKNIIPNDLMGILVKMLG